MPMTSTSRGNRKRVAVVVAVIVIALLAISAMFLPRQSKEGAAVPATGPATQSVREVTFRQRQRTTKVLPGVEGEVRLSVGDVTGGKVKVSVTTADGEALVEATAVKEGDVVDVPVGERKLLLTVKDLRNALIGTDEVVFVLREAGASAAMTEEEKIERLIAAVKELKGAKFIRNGGEHSAGDAVDHMRRKWERGKKEIRTAREFIEKVGSRSSLSGEAYRIRFQDGREVTAAEFFGKKLEEMEREAPSGNAVDSSVDSAKK